MVTYKDFTLREIQDSILNEQTKLSSSMMEDAVSWLHEALKLHTSRDGSCRDSQEICKWISKQFRAKYGGYWSVAMGNSFLLLHAQHYITFNLDNNEKVVIFCST
jgi:hypothetical protein